MLLSHFDHRPYFPYHLLPSWGTGIQKNLCYRRHRAEVGRVLLVKEVWSELSIKGKRTRRLWKRKDIGGLRNVKEFTSKWSLLKLTSSNIIEPWHEPFKYTDSYNFMIFVKFLLKHSRCQFIKVHYFVEVFLVPCHYFMKKVKPGETEIYSVTPA